MEKEVNTMSKFKLDAKQQEQIIMDLKSREVSEDVLDKVAGGLDELVPLLPREPKLPIVTTMAIGEEGNPGLPM